MGILSALGLRGKALTGTPAMLEVLNQRNWNPYVPLGGTNLRVDRINSVYVATQNASYGWIYRTSPPVRRVIDYIASNMAQLGVKVYEREADDKRRHAGDHPAAEALRWPNSWTGGGQFLFQFIVDFLVYNNAYALKFPSSSGLSLVNIPPPLVGLVGTNYFAVDGYQITNQNGEQFAVPPERMVHWRGYHPDDPRRGESKLETLREILASDMAGQQAVTEIYRAGLALPGWVERPLEAPEWSDEAMKRWREAMAGWMKKASREVPVFEEGMVYKQGGVTPEDAELNEARRWTNEQIASLYGMKNIPPASDEERKQFYADVLPPLTDSCAEVLNLHVLIREYGAEDHYFEFGREKLMDDLYKTLTSASGRPVLLTNEARAKIDQPPVEGGDELVTPANVIVGDNPKPSTGVMPIQNPNGPPQDGSHRSGEADEPDRAGRQASLNGHAKDLELKATPLIPRRRLAAQRRDRWAPEYEGVMVRHFERQRRALKSQKASTKAITNGRWNSELADGLNKVASRQFAAEGKHVAFRLASTFDPDYGENWLASKSVGSAQDINRITQEQADEFGLDKAFDQTGNRAVAAGMAYATDVAGFATKVAAEQAPGEPTITIDGGTCDLCEPFQGSWPMSQLEAWPSYHPSCSCVADVEGGIVKAIPVETKAQEIVVNNTPPAVHISLQVPEGMFQVYTPVDIHPAVTNVTTPDVNVPPTHVTIEKGAVESNVNLEAPAPADVRTIIDKGAIEIQNTIEAAKPADVHTTIEKGAMEVNVAPADVKVDVEAPPPAETTIAEGAISVEVSQPPPPETEPQKVTKRVVRDPISKRITSIEEERE